MLVSLAERMDPCADVARLVEEAIVEDPPATVKEGGVIRDGYDSGLDELRRIQREGKDWIARLEEREREITGIKSLKVGYNKVFGYYIEVTKANLRHLPEGRYQRKQTLANAERFITPELKERERQVLEAEERSIALEYRLFAEVREAIAEQIPRLQALAEEWPAWMCSNPSPRCPLNANMCGRRGRGRGVADRGRASPGGGGGDGVGETTFPTMCAWMETAVKSCSSPGPTWRERARTCARRP